MYSTGLCVRKKNNVLSKNDKHPLKSRRVLRGLTQKNWPNRPISPRGKALFRVVNDAKSIKEIQELLKQELVLASSTFKETIRKSHSGGHGWSDKTGKFPR